ncbi:hypothetical protein GTR02_03515 [Kineococcus sp. R8]|uniref:hypothetical protein n=1 Tax=Kineococcus siccus TaxID=2696567 RepID=UPI00196A2D34|nr:hypothetical protein [Kineococcus siccus]NAZ80886.1 hypothetical protein [Kineococcus siccus]
MPAHAFRRTMEGSAGVAGGVAEEVVRMGAVLTVLAGAGLVAGVLVVVGLALGGRAARAGRESGQLLVAPRGARFGDASRLVVVTARPAPVQQVQPARVTVHVHRADPRTWFHRAA